MSACEPAGWSKTTPRAVEVSGDDGACTDPQPHITWRGARRSGFRAIAGLNPTRQLVLLTGRPYSATGPHFGSGSGPFIATEPDDVVASQSLRDDLLQIFGTLLNNFDVIGIDNYRRLIADADDTLLNTLNAQITSLAIRTIYPALARARARGEIGPSHIPHRSATLIGTLVRDELFFARRNVDSTVLGEMLDTVYLPLIVALSH